MWVQNDRRPGSGLELGDAGSYPREILKCLRLRRFLPTHCRLFSAHRRFLSAHRRFDNFRLKDDRNSSISNLSERSHA